MTTTTTNSSTAVYYRGDGESRWLLLKNDLSDRYYSFDASLLPDGGYTVKVVASDAPSHSPGEALYAERVSARFEVDTTAPVIDNLTATAIDGKQAADPCPLPRQRFVFADQAGGVLARWRRLAVRRAGRTVVGFQNRKTTTFAWPCRNPKPRPLRWPRTPRMTTSSWSAPTTVSTISPLQKPCSAGNKPQYRDRVMSHTMEGRAFREPALFCRSPERSRGGSRRAQPGGDARLSTSKSTAVRR